MSDELSEFWIIKISTEIIKSVLVVDEGKQSEGFLWVLYQIT